MDSASVYLLRPWQDQYGQNNSHTLEAPVSHSLPAMAATAILRFAGNTAFTAVTPNGMYGSLKFAQVGALSDAFAVYLRQVLKLDAGDRVAVQMPNCLSYPVVLLGVLKAGCVAVNTNPLYTASEMTHQFKDSGAKVVVVVVDLFADKMKHLLKATDCPVKHVVLTRVSEFFPPVVGNIVHAVMKHWNKAIPAHKLGFTA